jgi:hypothetical protein
LIENNRNLILFLRLIDPRGNCGDPQGCGWGRILLQAGNEDGEHFRWRGREW